MPVVTTAANGSTAQVYRPPRATACRIRTRRRVRSEARLEDHVPGDDDDEYEDHARSPRPEPQLARGSGVVAGLDGSLGADRGAALEQGADHEGGGEEAEGQLDPVLSEIPNGAVD